MVMEGNLTFDGGHTIKYTDDLSQNCTLETYIIILTNVTSVNLIFLKRKMGGGSNFIHGQNYVTIEATLSYFKPRYS